MSKAIQYLRQMKVILFITFLAFSFCFVSLAYLFYNVKWDRFSSTYSNEQLKESAYKIMDDMRNVGMLDGPFTDKQNGWLTRRATIYGVMVRYQDLAGRPWFDSISEWVEDEHKVNELTFPFVADGMKKGNLTVSQVKSIQELNTANQLFRQMVSSGSHILFEISFLISIIVSGIAARVLSRHLQSLKESASLIRQGNYHMKAHAKGPEEVRRLAVTLNELSTELKKQEEWRLHLMEDLTHELRTPLTSMLSNVEAILDGIYEADEERLTYIYEEMHRLSQLVNDMENLSEAEAAVFTMKKKRTDLIQLARRVYENFQPMARDKGIKLVFQSVNVPCHVDVDRDKIVQVITNIVSNAIKYTPERGVVTLSVSWGIDTTCLTCEDTGIGISEQDLPYIFNRLYRADKSRSRFSGGVGLGLSIAKALVEAHNGTIQVESQVGKGSTFKVTVPNT